MKKPIVTPCRAGNCANRDVKSQSEVPDLLDTQAQAPKPGDVRLSSTAINSRLKRVFTPNVNGEYKVPAEIVKQWQCKRKGRKSLEQVFQSCGFSVDAILKDNIYIYSFG